jgi:hypothetical protein
MINNTNAAALSVRFIEEQENINRYIEVLQFETGAFEPEVREFLDLLEKFELLGLSIEKPSPLFRYPYPHEDLNDICEKVRPLLPEIAEKTEKQKEYIETLEEPTNLRKIDGRSFIGELIAYVSENLENNFSEKNIEWMRIELDKHLEIQEVDPSEEARLSNIGTTDVSDYTIRAVRYIYEKNKLADLYNIKALFEEFDFKLKLFSPQSEISLNRQAFILLMTIFDATLFDLVRLALKKDFFSLISIFGKQEKLSLKDFSSYTSFENFRDRIIEECLRNKYLKDLLFILEAQNISCIDQAEGNQFIHIIEMIQRRNIHVHNRGKVDEKYLEKDSDGKPKYNIHNLSLNDDAEITKEYLEHANRLCKNSVISIALWTDSLSC